MNSKYRSLTRVITCQGGAIILRLEEWLTGPTRTVNRDEENGVSTWIVSSRFYGLNGYDLVERRVEGGLIAAAASRVPGVLRATGEYGRRWADESLANDTDERQPNQIPMRVTTD